MPVRDFGVHVTAEAAESVTISAGGVDFSALDLEAALSGDLPPAVEGLERLVLAALRRFGNRPATVPGGVAIGPPVGGSRRDESRVCEIDPRRGLTLECSTTIPRQVGMAGSSATIIATLRALSSHFNDPISRFHMAEMALATEVEDLGIAGGPMDRVIQSYEQVMLLDLAGTRTEASYEALDPALLPTVLLAWTPSTGRPSGLTHSDLRTRWERGDPDVLRVMSELRGVVDRGVAAMRSGDSDAFADAVDRNYQLRVSVTDVTDVDARLVEIARDHGAAAKLCGSGGGVVVVPRRGTDVASLEGAFARADFPTCRPTVA